MKRRLRACDVEDSIIEQLTPASGQMVTYKGFRALLRLETGNGSNTVELVFDQTNGHPVAIGDYSILNKLPLRNPDAKKNK